MRGLFCIHQSNTQQHHIHEQQQHCLSCVACERAATGSLHMWCTCSRGSTSCESCSSNAQAGATAAAAVCTDPAAGSRLACHSCLSSQQRPHHWLAHAHLSCPDSCCTTSTLLTLLLSTAVVPCPDSERRGRPPPTWGRAWRCAAGCAPCATRSSSASCRWVSKVLAGAMKGQQQPGGAAGRHSRRSSGISVTSMSTSSYLAETAPPAARNNQVNLFLLPHHLQPQPLQLLLPWQVNDGSNLSGIQVVVEPTAAGFELLEGGRITTGGRHKAGAAWQLSCSMSIAVHTRSAPQGSRADDMRHNVELVWVLVSPASNRHTPPVCFALAAQPQCSWSRPLQLLHLLLSHCCNPLRLPLPPTHTPVLPPPRRIRRLCACQRPASGVCRQQAGSGAESHLHRAGGRL